MKLDQAILGQKPLCTVKKCVTSSYVTLNGKGLMLHEQVRTLTHQNLMEINCATELDALTRNTREEDTLLRNLVFVKNGNSFSFFCSNASLNSKAHDCKKMEEVKIGNSNNFILKSSEGKVSAVELQRRLPQIKLLATMPKQKKNL